MGCWWNEPEAAGSRLLYLPVEAAGAESLLPVRAAEPLADGLLVERA